MREGKTDRGRPRYGDEPKPKFVKFGISMPPDLYDRLEKYCERPTNSEYKYNTAFKVPSGENPPW